jgi:hypothetical protein
MFLFIIKYQSSLSAIEYKTVSREKLVDLAAGRDFQQSVRSPLAVFRHLRK